MIPMHSSRSPIAKIRLILALMAISVVTLVSCQSAGPDEPKGTEYTAVIAMDTSEGAHRYPQQITWKSGTDSGVATLTHSGATYTAAMKFAATPVGAVQLELWSAGVRYLTLNYNYTSEMNNSLVNPAVVQDSVATEILRRIYPKTDAHSFDSALAVALVNGENLVKEYGFPAKASPGIKVDSVLNLAMPLLLAKNQPISVLAKSWALGVDELSVHVRIQILIDAKVIVADTSTIFPPPLVRVTKPVSLDSILVAGATQPSAVTGSFAATYGFIGSEAKIFIGEQDATSSFDFPVKELSTLGKPKTFDLSGVLSVKAREATPVGLYRLQITMESDSGRVTSSANFRVAPAGDKVGPAFKDFSPISGTQLEYGQDSIEVNVVATDPSGVDSVSIQGKLATQIDSTWSVKKVFVPVTTVGYEILFKAKDKLGNASEAIVRVGRSGPPVAGEPYKVVLQPQANQVFVFDSATILVRWKVADPRAAISQVWIANEIATKESDSIWSRRVALASTGAPTTLGLLAINATNDSISSFVQVTRQLDTKGPSIDVLSPLDGSGVGHEIQSIVVRAKVSDPSGLDSVKINGVKAEAGTGGAEFLRSLVLEAGKTTEIVIEAWDKLKNKRSDTIHVARESAPDATAPKIVLVAPTVSGASVALNSVAFTLKWLVTDQFGVDDTAVTIEGRSAIRSGDTCSLVVAVPMPGKEQAYRIDVTNIKGVSSFKTVSLKRDPDAIAPVVVRQDSGRSVAFETEKASVSWKISDNYKLGAVTINGLAVVGVGGLFSQELPLGVGINPALLVVQDSAGNRTTDSVAVVRVWKDTSKPVLVRQGNTGNQNVDFAITEFQASWKATDNAPISVAINGIKAASTAGIYSATIPLATAITGVRIIATDSSGNKGTDSITISKSSDAIAPAIARLVGTKDTTVPYAVGTLKLGWKVTDNGTIKSVEIFGKPAIKLSDEYTYEVPLKIGGKTLVKIVAIDAVGNDSTDSVTITRGYHDSVAPVVTPSATTKDTTVPYATDKYTVTWTVTDNDAIKAVTIGGVAATAATPGVYSSTISLVVGPNKLEVAATDTANNLTTVSVTVTRTADAGAPTIVRGAGAKDRMIVYDSTATTLTWNVTDDVGVSSVKVNGTLIAPSAGSYTFNASDLKVGTNGFRIVASDASSKVATDTVTITRAWKDTVPPVVVPSTTTKDQTVTYATTSMLLTWKVTDNGAIRSVTIGGAAAVGSAGDYSKTVSLVLGPNRFVIVATDTMGLQTSQTVIITRSALVNSAPSFSKGLDVTLNEDAGAQIRTAWATGMSAGVQADESVQKLTFVITSSNDAAFSVKPAIDLATGNLSFTPAAQANGAVTVTLILKDDGGVLNGGVDASAPQTFQIKINPINDAPSFTIPASKAINEDAGAQEEVGFVSSFSAGPADEAVQSLAWTVSSTNPGLFTDVPVLVGTTLKYKTAPNANGSSVVTVRLKDNGGIDGSGVDETVKTWTLTVNPVNDAPSFTKGSDLAVKNYQAIQTIANWIKSKTAGGGADEAAQTFTFQVSSDLPSIFASQPSIDASGALTFAPSVNQYGIANVTVTIQDNGGIANGGANTSVAQTFKIEVQDTVMDEMGNSYPFKKLGTQTWMLQNMRNGAGVVPCDGKSGCSQTQLIGSNFSFASAFKLPATCNTTACSNLISNPIQGVCPVGWHIPAQTEWYTLMSFAGAGPDDPVAQSNLMATWSYEACSRSSSTATPVCKYSPGLDAFGFALPANRQNGGGGPGGAASWATFSMVWLPEEDPTYATSASALYNLSQDYTSKAVGSGVRCIKN